MALSLGSLKGHCPLVSEFGGALVCSIGLWRNPDLPPPLDRHVSVRPSVQFREKTESRREEGNKEMASFALPSKHRIAQDCGTSKMSFNMFSVYSLNLCALLPLRKIECRFDSVNVGAG